jgi:flagellar motor switch protein FliN/FliY
MSADAFLAAAAGAFESLVPGGVTAVQPAAPVDDPLASAELPAVFAAAPVGGANPGTAVLVLTVSGARRLAAALGAIDEEEAEFGGGDLGERELAAVAQALDGLLAAAAGATSGGASARLLAARDDASSALDRDAVAVAADLTLLGEPARLALLAAATEESDAGAAPAPADPTPLGPALRGISVRVWAELGRTRMPTGEVVGLPPGAIVELDRDADDAVDLYVDGQPYASGRLVVTDDDSWGVLVEHVHGLR